MKPEQPEFSWPLFKFAELADPHARLSLGERETMREWRRVYLCDDRRKELWGKLYDGKKVPKLVSVAHCIRIFLKYTWPCLGLAVVAGQAGIGAAFFLAIPFLPIQGWLMFLFVTHTWEVLVLAAVCNLEKRG